MSGWPRAMSGRAAAVTARNRIGCGRPTCAQENPSPACAVPCTAPDDMGL